jgi:sporulation protein YlmC with PRC-barrel domain
MRRIEAMRTELLAAVAALALTAGTAWAESAGSSSTSSQSGGSTTSSATQRSGSSGASSSSTMIDTSKPMTRESASMLLGKEVVGSNSQPIGQVKDVILDSKTGHAKQAVLELTQGSKEVAVPITDLHMQSGAQNELMLRNHTPQQVQAMSAFTYDSSTVSLNRSGSSTSGSSSSTLGPSGSSPSGSSGRSDLSTGSSRSSTSSGASTPNAAGTSAGGSTR